MECEKEKGEVVRSGRWVERRVERVRETHTTDVRTNERASGDL